MKSLSLIGAVHFVGQVGDVRLRLTGRMQGVLVGAPTIVGRSCVGWRKEIPFGQAALLRCRLPSRGARPLPALVAAGRVAPHADVKRLRARPDMAARMSPRKSVLGVGALVGDALAAHAAALRAVLLGAPDFSRASYFDVPPAALLAAMILQLVWVGVRGAVAVGVPAPDWFARAMLSGAPRLSVNSADPARSALASFLPLPCATA